MATTYRVVKVEVMPDEYEYFIESKSIFGGWAKISSGLATRESAVMEVRRLMWVPSSEVVWSWDTDKG